jgi:hypothetical protein
MTKNSEKKFLKTGRDGCILLRGGLFGIISFRFCVGFVVYMALNAFCVYPAPDLRHRVAGGFVLRKEIRELQENDKTLTVEQLLAGADPGLPGQEGAFEATMIWEPWSVSAARFLLLVSWFAFVGPFFFLCAVLVLMEHKRHLARGKRP